MTTFIEFHALRSFPPSNLNRDDLGTPKTAIFGGARRLRISSQCLKRTWRTSDHFRGEFAAEQLGVRTDRLPDQVLKGLAEKEVVLTEAEQIGLMALLSSIGKKGKPKAADAGDDDDEESADAEDATKSEAIDGETKTAHLLFLSRQEIEAVVSFADAKRDALSKVMKRGKVDAKPMDKLRKELESHLQDETSRNAVDIGLFGRFVTSDEFDTVDGALQVAHAIGTQKVEVEYDYFTAVDDLGDSAGAGHLGETEFASSVLYMYACCDLDQLERNLGSRSKDGRSVDDESVALARKGIPALIRAIAEATPKGKRTGTAPHTPAEYLEVVVRTGAPLSFANAFGKPVEPREQEGDVMSASIARFDRHKNAVETAYGRQKDVTARFILSLKDVELKSLAVSSEAGASGAAVRINTIDELTKKLAAALAKAPKRGTA